MNRRLWTPLLWTPLLLVAALLSLSCGQDESTRVLRLGHGLDVGHPVHRAMEHMSERLAELSGERLTMKIYPSEQLGSERECVELLQIGSLAMTKVSAAVAEGFIPEYGVFGLPYLFEDAAHAEAVLDGEIGRDMLETGGDVRLRGLCFFDAGSRSFYTRERPVHAPSDLEGLKIRTQESAAAMRMVRALGAAATPISWGELYTALQQGVVDGAENNPPSFYLSRHYEVCPYYTLDEHTTVPDVLLMSKIVWDSLDDEERSWLQQAADEGARFQRRIWQEASDEALTAVEAAGVEVIRPAKEPFVERVDPLWNDARADPNIAPWLQRIRDAIPAQEISTGDAP